MRVMYDAVNPNVDLPADAQLVAGYIDGWYQSYGPLTEKYPQLIGVPIAVWPSTNGGVVLDVETGDATPYQAPAWVQMRRDAGVDPSIYCSLSVWPQVIAQFDDQGIAQPHYWIAAYPGNGPNLYDGSIAHQYGGDSDAGWDVSVVADFWPGVDSTTPIPPIPPPTPLLTKDDPMFGLTDSDGTSWFWFIGLGGNIYRQHKAKGETTWSATEPTSVPDDIASEPQPYKAP